MSRTAPAEPAPAPTCRPAPDIIEPHSAAGPRVSEETFWEAYYPQSDIHYEWNNGVLEEKPVPDGTNRRPRASAGAGRDQARQAGRGYCG